MIDPLSIHIPISGFVNILEITKKNCFFSSLVLEKPRVIIFISADVSVIIQIRVNSRVSRIITAAHTYIVID